MNPGRGNLQAAAERGPVVTVRRLDAPGRPTLELLACESGIRGQSPILFLHGAFAGAWCWTEQVIPFFARRGRSVAALSLRGHGTSEGGDALRHASIEDLLDDLLRAIAALDSPPILVGHSLGGYLAQLAIGRAALRGLVLLGSVPPDGLALMGTRLMVSDPTLWAEAMASSVSGSRTMTSVSQLTILFGEGASPERVGRYAAQMVPESARALAEAHLPRPVQPAYTAALPTLALSGLADRLVWPATTLRTALYHGATCDILPGGHFVMLEPESEAFSRRILDWIDHRGL